jgi:dipeptidyl aminopeptidase/acylaminoacyl peptidase
MRLIPALAAAVWVSLSPALAQETRDPRPTLQQFLRIRTPGAPVRLPDGSWLTRDWPDGINQVYRVTDSAVRPTSPAAKLTSFPDGASGFSVSPDYSRVLVFASAGGNENTQVYLLNPDTAEVTPILDNPRVQYAMNGWIGQGEGFLFTANEESPSDFYVYRYDFKAGKATRLLGKPGAWSASDITADGSRVLVDEYRSISDSSSYELDTRTGELRDLSTLPGARAGGTVSVNTAGYMPDDRSILMTSDAQGGTRRLFLIGPDGKASRPISEVDPLEIDGVSINQERTLLAVETNEQGLGVVRLYRLPSFEKVPMPEVPSGVVGISQMRGDQVTWTLSNARTPGLCFGYTAPAAGAPAGKASQITFTDTQGIDLSRFPLPEVVRYKSSKDGLEISALLWLPPGYTRPGLAANPIPFIANYHGGPEGQFRPGWSAATQYLLSRGFGVIQPNVRGSTGFGRDFHMKDDYKGRWGSVSDGVDAAEWLVENGYSQPGMIATYGGSYGGYMSVACLVEDQMRVDAGRRKQAIFGAGVNVVGIVNLKTFLEKTAGYRRKLREVEYGPLSDPDFLLSASSMTHIDKIRVPMFIAHGFNDPRVPVEEAMQVAVALKDRAVASGNMRLVPRLFVAPDEGHGFAKLDNRVYFTERMEAFLSETIGGSKGR